VLELDGRQVQCNFDCVLLTMGFAIMTFTIKVMRTQTRLKLIVLLRFQNVSCRSVSVGFAEKTSVFGSD